MYYQPHILQRRSQPREDKDEFGRPVIISDEDEWEDICRCRCDHNTDVEMTSMDGKRFQPEFHVVCNGPELKVAPGDYVRCLRADGTVKGEGTVLRPHSLNYLHYAEFYI